MDIIQKIGKLNKYVTGTLSITHYGNGWDISSYGDRCLFNGCGVLAKTFRGVVEKAYRLMLLDKERKGGKNEKGGRT